ncbi:putative DNA-binding protein (UPF0251 family) [Marinilabilia salmonicolor]|jgi:predicted DNA-binding protein (UPF0251 family)|uniref:Putative DNA-binding protein (UPF0251 family) n=2 Tax=Marinilabilia salmonicolor TaxID=989 RepID=A0A368VCY7_9BACT|nr:putative DNA-binding protein (UPF0251 family) [Marinilabilia salmonicolor]
MNNSSFMARPKSLRKVVKPPGFKGYKPYGNQNASGSPVELLYEEYEALKLADFDLMNHLEASRVMGVSRATFARIYERARRKVALALVEVKEIKAVYGHAYLDKSWLICNNCNARFTIPQTASEHNCPVCRSSNVEAVK